MKKIVKITRLTGKTVDSFPKVGWIGNRSTICSIESNLRGAVLAAADIEHSDVLADMQQAGEETAIYGLIGQRTLTAQVATEGDLQFMAAQNPALVAGQVGFCYPNPSIANQMLVTVAPYTQDNLEKVAPTYNELLSQLSGVNEAAAVTEFETAENAIISAADKAITMADKRAQQNKWNAEQAKLRADAKALKAQAHTADLTGAPAANALATA